MLAKAVVERSNRFTRSIFSKVSKPRFAGAFVRFDAVEIAGEEATQKGAVYPRVTNSNAAILGQNRYHRLLVVNSCDLLHRWFAGA